MKIFRALMIGFVLLIGFLTASGCSKTEYGKQNKKIVIGYLPIIAHLPAEVAKEKGKFSDLDIEFRVFESSNDILIALANNDINATTTIAVAPVAGLASEMEKKGESSPILIYSYSRTETNEPFDGVFVNRNSDIEKLSDLVGRKLRIGVFPGTTAKRIFSYYLKNNYNVNLDNITWVFLPPKLQLAKLRDGDIDVLYTYETVRTLSKLNNMKEIHGSVIAGILEGAPYGSSAINKKFANEHPELAKKFIKAMDWGIEYVREHKTEGSLRKILVERLNVTPDVAKECNLETRLTSKEISSQNNFTQLVKFIEILKDIGELSEEVDSRELARDITLVE